MKVIVTKNYEEASLEAFKVMKEVVANKPNAVLGLATGSTPLGLYKNMIEDHKTNGTSYKDITTFNLDEYVGLDRNHKESYYTFMNTNLFSGLDIPAESVHLPYGNTKEDCDAYEKAMENYQVDIQLLGLGEMDTLDSMNRVLHLKKLLISLNYKIELVKIMLVSLMVTSTKFLLMPLQWVSQQS